MRRRIHLVNPAGRDATVMMETVKPPYPPRPGLPDRDVSFTRYLAAVTEHLDEALQGQFGEQYGDMLVVDDPEVDIESIGRTIEKTEAVWLAANGDVLHTSPVIREVVEGPHGEVREERAPIDTPSNVNDDLPVSWTGRKLPRADAARQFAFLRAMQLRHVDGLTYDFLFEMAKELHDEQVVVLLGGGAKGRDPLVLQENGTPFRAFLEGRVDGDRYMLLLHLSNMEFRPPAPKPAAPTESDDGDEGEGDA